MATLLIKPPKIETINFSTRISVFIQNTFFSSLVVTGKKESLIQTYENN